MGSLVSFSARSTTRQPAFAATKPLHPSAGGIMGDAAVGMAQSFGNFRNAQDTAQQRRHLWSIVGNSFVFVGGLLAKGVTRLFGCGRDADPPQVSSNV